MELERTLIIIKPDGVERALIGPIITRFEQRGLKLVALTKGSSGSRLMGEQGDSSHQGAPTAVSDTVGAGDAFTATMILGLLQGRGLDEINSLANQVASFVCSQQGATPVLPDHLKLVPAA